MQSLTRITYDTSMSRYTALHSLHTKVKSSSHIIKLHSNRVAGGIFKLELFLPDDYPMTPPKIRFLTKIYHPNIDKLGRICLDVLKSESRTLEVCCLICADCVILGNWSPALQIRTILLSIQALLGAPNPDDPLAPEVAKRWKEDEQAAIATAKEWTRTHAMT